MQGFEASLPPPKHKRSTDEVFSEPQRLHKVLASCGFGSRRAMEDLILAGRNTFDVGGADEGLAHDRRIDVELNIRFSASLHVVLKIGRDDQREVVAPGIHALIELGQRRLLR